MKKTLFYLLILSICFLEVGCALAEKEDLKGTISLSGAWAIYPTAVAWAKEFQRIYPKVKIDVSAGGAGKGAADALAGLVDIGMVSRQPDPAEIEKGIFAIYILHDAVYPVVSKNNPALNIILSKGIKKKAWMDLYINASITTWDELLAEKIDKPIHLYTRSDSCGAAASWAAYLGKKQEDLKGIGVYGDPGILETVKKDPLGIGYANFSYVFSREGQVIEGLQIAPIDINENGKADADEVFKNRQEAIKALEEKRYPVTRKNYFFTKGKPQGLVKEFIEFCLSEIGVKIVNDVGASLPLPEEERKKVLLEISQ